MAWTTPATWSAGEVPTASKLNTHLRDNLTFLHTLHGARAYKGSTQSISTNAGEGFTALTFVDETFDSDSIHSNSSNTSRFTIPSGMDGFWYFHGQIEYASGGGNQRDANLRYDGATLFAKTRIPPPSGVVARVSVTGIVYLTAAQYVELGANQDSGGNLNVDAGSELSFLECYYLGA